MTSWDTYVYRFEGGWYECASQRFIASFDNEVDEQMYLLWISFLILEKNNDPITFNTLYDMAQFLIQRQGTYEDFTGTLTIDNIMGL